MLCPWWQLINAFADAFSGRAGRKISDGWKSGEGLVKGWWDLEAPGAAENPLCWSEPWFSHLQHSVVVPRRTLIKQRSDPKCI